MTLPKLHSITKKLTVALLGGFLLIFLLFHMCANLMILKDDGGAAYGAFCHFMGSNIVVKLCEVVLLGVIALHILLTLWLAVTNRMARPVRYHEAQKSTTHTTSKFMVWTGILIIACIGLHFYDFYMVKLGVVKGEYMVKTEKLQDDEMNGIAQLANQMQMTPDQLLEAMRQEMDPNDAEAADYFGKIESKLKLLGIINRSYTEGNVSKDMIWIHKLTKEDKEVILDAIPDCEIEPDFYYMAREKFKVWYIALGYLVFFVILFFHLTHAFPSAFQTLGLNNYKYNRAIEICGKIYTWIVCLGFAVIPIVVFLG
ncbi:MAG: hypothetical protein J5711_04835 [Bacteroidales bacterium]|nr:hypothetical protein [Bacteroidales bacterium]